MKCLIVIGTVFRICIFWAEIVIKYFVYVAVGCRNGCMLRYNAVFTVFLSATGFLSSCE